MVGKMSNTKHIDAYCAPAEDGSIGIEFWNAPARMFLDFGPGPIVTVYLNLADGSPSEQIDVALGENDEAAAGRASDAINEMFAKLTKAG